MGISFLLKSSIFLDEWKLEIKLLLNNLSTLPKLTIQEVLNPSSLWYFFYLSYIFTHSNFSDLDMVNCYAMLEDICFCIC